jgi:tRNA dimethylallyltransferase
MLAAGFLAEVQALREKGYADAVPVRGAAGYRELSACLDGEYDLEEAVRRTRNAHHRLARRQAAWFRQGDGRIHWLEAGEEAASKAVATARQWQGEARQPA